MSFCVNTQWKGMNPILYVIYFNGSPQEDDAEI